MAFDISAPTLKRRAVGMVLEKISGYATVGMIFGGVAMFFAASGAIGTLKERFSFNEVTATVTVAEEYCKFGKLKLGGENKGFKFSDNMDCIDAYALQDSPEYDGYKLFEKTRYFFTYTNPAGATVEAEKPSHYLGSDSLTAGDQAQILVDPDNSSKFSWVGKPMFSSLEGLAGGAGLVLFLLSFGLSRFVRRKM